MQIKDELLKRKKEILLEMLFNREITLFWDFIEKDSVRSKITSLMKIRTMLHKAWQILEFQIFKALIEIIAEIIKNRIKNDVLELCYYVSKWFDSVRFLSSENRIDVDLIFRRIDFELIWFDSIFYRFAIDENLKLKILFTNCH
jgi:hypothetical protein